MDRGRHAGSAQRLPTTEGSWATSGVAWCSRRSPKQKLKRRPCSPRQRRLTSLSAAAACQCSTKKRAISMLDYQAHKLYWLLTGPFRALAALSMPVIIIASILAANAAAYGLLGRVSLAVGLLFMFLVVYWIIFALVVWAFDWIFFWLIDVVPAHGSDLEQAEQIVRSGRAAELAIKLVRDSQNWTAENTAELYKSLNWHWRRRLFFPTKTKERLERSVSELKRMYQQTGTQPVVLDGAKIREILRRLQRLSDQKASSSLFEEIVMSPLLFFVIGFILIIIFVGLG